MIGPVVVTEAELLVLEAAHRRLTDGPARAPRPWTMPYAGGSGSEEEARRSLIVRGLLGPDGELAEDHDLGQLVTVLLEMRAAAPRGLLVERVVGHPAGSAEARTGLGGRVGCRVVWLVDTAACVEDVHPDGSHQLHLLLDPEEVVACVTAVTVPPDAVPGERPRIVPAQQAVADLAPTLGVTALAELAVLRPAEEAGQPVDPWAVGARRQLVGLGPTGCWTTEVVLGRPLPDPVTLEPVGPGWVEEWARSALDGRGPGGRPGQRGEQGTMSG